MRAWFRVAVSLVFCACVLADEPARQSRFELVHVPLEAYQDEPATFAMRGTTGDEVVLKLDDKVLARKEFETDRLEINCALKPGTLTISCKDREVQFRVLPPDTELKLRWEKGFLYADDAPVILLPKHRCPPKHDRTWEVGKILRSIFTNVKPELSGFTLVTAKSLKPDDLSALSTATGTEGTLWKSPSLDETIIYEIDRVLCAEIPKDKNRALILALNGQDLTRGMAALSLRMRIEWFLQRCSGFTAMYVVSLPLDERQRSMFPSIPTEFSLAARSNCAAFLSVLEGETLSERLPQAVNQIRKKYKF